MVRLSDLTEDDARHLLAKDCSRFETAPYVTGPRWRGAGWRF